MPVPAGSSHGEEGLEGAGKVGDLFVTSGQYPGCIPLVERDVRGGYLGLEMLGNV